MCAPVRLCQRASVRAYSCVCENSRVSAHESGGRAHACTRELVLERWCGEKHSCLQRAAYKESGHCAARKRAARFGRGSELSNSPARAWSRNRARSAPCESELYDVSDAEGSLPMLVQDVLFLETALSTRSCGLSGRRGARRAHAGALGNAPRGKMRRASCGERRARRWALFCPASVGELALAVNIAAGCV